jgi:restriction system protein
MQKPLQNQQHGYWCGEFGGDSGKFTADAQEFARGRNITLVDGERLHAMLQAAGAGRKAGAGPASAATLVAPACPVCGAAMVKRVAKRGSNAGNAFNGCSTFPKCRGIVKV